MPECRYCGVALDPANDVMDARVCWCCWEHDTEDCELEHCRMTIDTGQRTDV